jgi:hypothetical protein
MDWIDWLRIEIGGGLLWTRQWIFGFHKMLGSFWVAERLAAPQEGPVSRSQLIISLLKNKYDAEREAQSNLDVRNDIHIFLSHHILSFIYSDSSTFRMYQLYKLYCGMSAEIRILKPAEAEIAGERLRKHVRC